VTIAVLMQQLVALVAKVLPQSDEDGQGLAEYALILALIAIVAIVALIYLGGQISNKLSVVGNAL
jgi:pilus assembly protein Flp/PilA